VVMAAGLDQAQARESVQHHSLQKVAAQFEAVLLETLVDGLQKTFSSFGGDQESGIRSTYDYLGTQAIASAWAQTGGIGLARMISDKFQ